MGEDSNLETTPVTVHNISDHLEHDNAVKVAGIDVDGIIRGKLMAKSKFLSLVKSGKPEFGFCSVIFGWDMHDQTYFRELLISNRDNGYRDIIARIDFTSFRRIPWEKNIPFFLVHFHDPDTNNSLSACPRSLLARTVEKLAQKQIKALAGAEYEFYMFQSPDAGIEEQSSAATARYLQHNPPHKLQHMTEGMLGYSLFDPVRNQEWYYQVFNDCEKFRCDIEGWHTESGPGVYEAALKYGEVSEMADRAALFKFATKNISSKYGLTPCFMAKPRPNLPGNSGHMHISLADASDGQNLFAAGGTSQVETQYADAAGLSQLGQYFLAGLLEGLPDIMPMFAPTVNSYKRLVENFWAPVTVSWGLEHRAASIRVIGPPMSDAKATRFEVRVPGADTNPHLALAAIVACGWRGVEKKLRIPVAPLGKGEEVGGEADDGERLAKSLKEATERFMRQGSIAREVLGDEFVDHFGGTRQHEVRLWDEAITDWEVRRYIEMV